MSEFFTNIASSLGKDINANPGKSLLSGIGVLQDILAQRKRSELLGQYENLVNNPAAAEKKIESLTAPLDQGLIQSVENQTQGYLGERGLSESPQISESVLSQSLAPYIQQNKEAGIQEYETFLQQLLSAANPNLLPGSFDISKLLASFKTPTKAGTTPPNTTGTSPSDTSQVWQEVDSPLNTDYSDIFAGGIPS